MSVKKPAQVINRGAVVAPAEIAPPIKPAPLAIRMALSSGMMGVQYAAERLAKRDADNEGWDDYWAGELAALGARMQYFVMTGKLPPSE